VRNDDSVKLNDSGSTPYKIYAKRYQNMSEKTHRHRSDAHEHDSLTRWQALNDLMIRSVSGSAT
jgi:hypothetical protein